MTDAGAFASGKGHRDENFPVASWLVRRELRAPILAFYRFVRAADDVADHPSAGSQQKARPAGTNGSSTARRGRRQYRRRCPSRGPAGAQTLPTSHALDLLKAFRRDVDKRRYADWSELMDYCRYSAAPVGRFVLDVHGEATALWPGKRCALHRSAGDQSSAGLRRGLPDAGSGLHPRSMRWRFHGAAVEDLAATQAAPTLLQTIGALALRTSDLLEQSRSFPHAIADRRLALEVGAIQTLAENLAFRLSRRDPLSQRVHHHPLEAALLSGRGALGVMIGWLGRHRQPRYSGRPG